VASPTTVLPNVGFMKPPFVDPARLIASIGEENVSLNWYAVRTVDAAVRRGYIGRCRYG